MNNKIEFKIKTVPVLPPRSKLVLFVLMSLEISFRTVSPSGKCFKLCQGPMKTEITRDTNVRLPQMTIMFEKVNEVETIR